MAYVLSPHAVQRLAERATLPPEAATALLNVLKPVFVGHQAGDNRVHMVFYSEPDARYFIAVANVRTEVVATVLTLEQYQQKRGPVEEGKLLSAKHRALPDRPRDPRPGAGMLVLVRVVAPDGYLKTVSLGRLADYSMATPPEVLAEDQALVAYVQCRCAERAIDMTTVSGVFVRERAKDALVEVPSLLQAQQRWAGAFATEGARPQGNAFFGVVVEQPQNRAAD